MLDSSFINKKTGIHCEKLLGRYTLDSLNQNKAILWYYRVAWAFNILSDQSQQKLWESRAIMVNFHVHPTANMTVITITTEKLMCDDNNVVFSAIFLTGLFFIIFSYF